MQRVLIVETEFSALFDRFVLTANFAVLRNPVSSVESPAKIAD